MLSYNQYKIGLHT